MKFISYGSHARFEEFVYQTFPIDPVPKVQWKKLDMRTSFAEQAMQLLIGRRWPDVIGNRLDDGELDLSLSIWMKILPLDIFHYYLPSHLMFASILLNAAPDTLMYPMYVMQSLILPPSTDKKILEKIDEEGLFESCFFVEDAEIRMDLYKRMTKEQRTCAAQFLDLYIDHRRANFSERGIQIVLQSRDIWKNSLLEES